MMLSIILSLALGAQTGTQAVAREHRIVTPSGDPEILLLDRDVYEARHQIAYVCKQLDWIVSMPDRARTMSCEVPTRDQVLVTSQPINTGIDSVSARGGSMLNLDNWTRIPVRRVVYFEFEPVSRGVVARANAVRMIPGAGGIARYNRQPIDDPATFKGLLNVMALAGDSTFAPGTRFADIGYLGFRSDRFADVELDGEERTAIQVGVVEGGSPAEAAGLKAGDFILRMNGRAFDSYREVAKYLSEVEPGTEVAMLVERGGERMALSATATEPPETLATP